MNFLIYSSNHFIAIKFDFFSIHTRNNFLYQSRKLLYDAGMDWESLTIFGPIRFK